MGRRGHGEGALFYDEDRDRWVALLELPPDGSGRRRRRKVTGRTKTDARRKLRQLQRRLEDGLPTGNGSMTLGDFLERWLTGVLPARSQVQAKSTITNYRWAAGHASCSMSLPTTGSADSSPLASCSVSGRASCAAFAGKTSTWTPACSP